MKQFCKFNCVLVLLAICSLVQIQAAAIDEPKVATPQLRLPEALHQLVPHPPVQSSSQGNPLTASVGISTRDLIDDPIFYLSYEKMTWYAANYYCLSRGWSLVSIKTAADTIKINGFLLYYQQSNDYYWTSGNSIEDTRTWRWGVGGPFLSYTNWNVGEPNNKYGEENCIELWTGNLKWNDEACASLRSFICEK